MQKCIKSTQSDNNMSNEIQAREALEEAISRFSVHDLAVRWDVDSRTIESWRSKSIKNPGLIIDATLTLLESPQPQDPSRASEFSFIDLFAGIGGTRLGFEAIGGECVFTSEWDKFAQETYRANFPPTHSITGDIREVAESEVPDHDVLIAGFPCQPFSLAGVSKKNSLGRAHGFACETQGTLFFDIARILDAKRPSAFLLENVKNLAGHDKGKTLDVILKTLRDELGYHVDYKVIDARHFVPQHRERVFIVGFKQPTNFAWDQVMMPDADNPLLGSILHSENGEELAEPEFTLGPKALVNSKYTLSKKLWRYLRDYAAKHREKGNGFGYSCFGPDGVGRTLSARYHKDGSEILISRGARKNPRRLTPRECARLMGFPDSYRIPVSDTQAYRQFGNSIVVPVVQAVATAMYPHLMAVKQESESDQLAMVV
jgi:DNA (cytosine-5)-methyltransferase 1